MKKSILNFGKALNKAEQKKISGGLISLIKVRCIVPSSDLACCAIDECGETGGVLRNNSGGYGTSANCVCY